MSTLTIRMTRPVSSPRKEALKSNLHCRANTTWSTPLPPLLPRWRSSFMRPVPGRLNLLNTAAGWTVIDDTYNANPASLYSALQVLANMQGTSWLVLGDMKELGENSRKLHFEVGDAARSLGVSRLFAIGEMSESTVDAFGEGASHFPDQDSLVEALCAELRPGVNCLVKGSRSMGMEAVVAAITRNQGMRQAC